MRNLFKYQYSKVMNNKQSYDIEQRGQQSICLSYFINIANMLNKHFRQYGQ